MVAGELVALLVTETLPLKAPPLAGANATLIVALVPAARVRGVVTPLTLNPVPDAATCETVIGPVPELVRVACNVLLLPTLTLPKLRLRGLALRRYDRPKPDSETVVGEPPRRLTTDTVPLAVPATVGVKVTLKLTLFPIPKLKGSETPLVLKPAPVTVTCEMVRMLTPVF